MKDNKIVLTKYTKCELLKPSGFEWLFITNFFIDLSVFPFKTFL